MSSTAVWSAECGGHVTSHVACAELRTGLSPGGGVVWAVLSPACRHTARKEGNLVSSRPAATSETTYHFRWLSRLVRLPAMSSCKYFSSQARHTVYKLMRRIQDRCSLVKSNKALGTISRVSFTFRATTKAVACIIIVATTSFSRDKTWAGTLLVPLSGICLHASCQTLTSRFIRLNPGIVILQSLLDFCGVHFK